MKKIIFFDAYLGEGGAERVISILANYMVENGIEVEIILYYDRDVFYHIDDRVKMLSIEKETKSTNILTNLLFLRKYVKENAAVLISFLAAFNMMAIVATRGLSLPVIVADRNDPTKVPEKAIVRKARDYLYSKADHVIVQTETNKLYFPHSIQKKTSVIYNPVNIGNNKGIALTTEKENLVVSVGRLVPQKNQVMLIDAFSCFNKNHPDYKLIIYGEGNQRNQLQKKIDALGMTNSILLPGVSNNILFDISRAKAFVLTSDYEGMPNALIEAMCIGLPVISTKVSGATDLIEDGKNGFLIDCNNSFKLSTVLHEVVTNEKSTDEIAKNALKINDMLSVDIIIKQWVDILDKFKSQGEEDDV